MQHELPLSENRLSEKDFFRIMQIVNCRWVVLCMELKSRLDARRSELIDQKGIDSLKYIKQLVADNKEVTAL